MGYMFAGYISAFTGFFGIMFGLGGFIFTVKPIKTSPNTGIYLLVLSAIFFVIAYIAKKIHDEKAGIVMARRNAEELTRKNQEEQKRNLEEQNRLAREEEIRQKRILDEQSRIAAENARIDRENALIIQQREAEERAYRNSPEGMKVRAAQEIADIERQKAIDDANIRIAEQERLAEIARDIRREEQAAQEALIEKASKL